MVIDDDRDDSQPIDVNIVERIKHPDYKSQSKYNDIALLRLESQIKFNKYVRPACLPTSYNPITTNAIATGWGVTEYQGSQSKSLMRVILELYSIQECNSTFGRLINRQLKDGILEATQMCAGSHIDRRDTCQVNK